MKKLLALLLAALMVLSMAACGGSDKSEKDTANEQSCSSAGFIIFSCHSTPPSYLVFDFNRGGVATWGGMYNDIAILHRLAHGIAYLGQRTF